MEAQKSTTSALPSSQPSVSETPTVTTTSTPRPPPDTDGEDEAPSDAEDEDEMDVDGVEGGEDEEVKAPTLTKQILKRWQKAILEVSLIIVIYS